MNMHLGGEILSGEILGWGALAICWALEFTQSQLILYTRTSALPPFSVLPSNVSPGGKHADPGSPK